MSDQYVPTVWEDADENVEGGGQPFIEAANLNHIEQGIKTNDDYKRVEFELDNIDAGGVGWKFWVRLGEAHLHVGGGQLAPASGTTNRTGICTCPLAIPQKYWPSMNKHGHAWTGSGSELSSTLHVTADGRFEAEMIADTVQDFASTLIQADVVWDIPPTDSN